MKKASLVLSIVAICISTLTFALFSLEFLYKKIDYSESDLK